MRCFLPKTISQAIAKTPAFLYLSSVSQLWYARNLDGDLQFTLMTRARIVLQPGEGKWPPASRQSVRAALKLLNKLLQIADQMLLIGDEIGDFICWSALVTIKFPPIVLLITDSSAENPPDVLPPDSNFLQGTFRQAARPRRRALWIRRKALEEIPGGSGKKVFKGDRHSLRSPARTAHHILGTAGFKVGHGYRPCRVLNRW